MQVVPDWRARIFEPIAAFYYEPVVAIYPINHVTLLVSPVNLGLVLVLAVLVGLNVALALQLLWNAHRGLALARMPALERA